MEDSTALLAVPRHLNTNKVARDIKREDVSLFNCLASIAADSEFVAVAALHHALPLVANLRCGAWYVERPDATCYFKARSPMKIRHPRLQSVTVWEQQQQRR